MKKIIYGYLKKVKGKLQIYVEDNLPDEAEDLVFISKKDLDQIIKGEISALMETRQPMPKKMFQASYKKIWDEETYVEMPPLFENEVCYNDLTGKEHKLFLDRYFMSHDFTKQLFVRYASVDQSLEEEG